MTESNVARRLVYVQTEVIHDDVKEELKEALSSKYEIMKEADIWQTCQIQNVIDAVCFWQLFKCSVHLLVCARS